jgi:hypothetical protein
VGRRVRALQLLLFRLATLPEEEALYDDRAVLLQKTVSLERRERKLVLDDVDAPF